MSPQGLSFIPHAGNMKLKRSFYSLITLFTILNNYRPWSFPSPFFIDVKYLTTGLHRAGTSVVDKSSINELRCRNKGALLWLLEFQLSLL
jgi:hypothetical protein